MKKTALNEQHRQLGARMVPFGGWDMPIQYSGVLAEHKAVRELCGIFDVSHMGQVFISGPDASEYLQLLTMNNIKLLSPGRSQYSAFLNEQGGFVDDIIVYQLWRNDYLVCMNAANIDKDVEWLRQHQGSFNVLIEDKSGEYSQLAVQGPTSLDAITRVLSEEDSKILGDCAYGQIVQLHFKGTNILIARTGYTGEKGFEIYTPNSAVHQLWSALLEHATPIGLGARDTLRLEACYLLYGNDMNDETTPLEAGVSWAVKFDCGPFIGKQALETQKANGLSRRLVAFKLREDGIPRAGMPVHDKDGNVIGHVTSGSTLPTVGGAGGMALVSIGSTQEGTLLQIDVRGKKKAAEVVKRPLYTARTKS